MNHPTVADEILTTEVTVAQVNAMRALIESFPFTTVALAAFTAAVRQMYNEGPVPQATFLDGAVRGLALIEAEEV